MFLLCSAERPSVIFEHLPLAFQLRKELAEWLKTETQDSIEGSASPTVH